MLTLADWETIRSSTLARCVPEDELRHMIHPRTELVLRRGDELFVQGDTAATAFIVLEGLVKLVRLAEGGEEALITVLRRGDSIGEISIFAQRRHYVTAIAVSPCRVIPLGASQLRQAMSLNPQIGFGLLAMAAEQQEALVEQIEIIKLLSSEERVVQFLLDLSRADRGPARFALPYEKTLIANRLGIKPETLSRALARLKALGVDVNGMMVAIEDVARLSSALVNSDA